MQLNSSSSEGSTNCFAGFDAVPQLAAKTEGCRGAKGRQGAGNKFSSLSPYASITRKTIN
jgi:hypothetical protein